jgi:hypothetical protein
MAMADELVTIRNFAYGPDPVSQAELARIRLETAGIPCFLANRQFAAVNWFYAGASRGVKLQVRASDVEKAREVLGTEGEALDPGEAGGSEAEQILCPRCGSEDVEYERFSRRVFYLSLLLLGFPLLWGKRKQHCCDCGYVWRETGGTDQRPGQTSEGEGTSGGQ